MIADICELTPEEYELFRKLVYEKSGIDLGGEKLALVRARLGKRLRKKGFESYREYYDFVVRNPQSNELGELLDAISTNTTHLFRESRHFDFLRNAIERWTADPGWRAANPALRIWSAGCSSGEEPYSIAMVAHDIVRGHAGTGIKILATDLSTHMLECAREGLFDSQRVGSVPAELKRRYLKQVRTDQGVMLSVVPELRGVITFARFNLMTPVFPFRQGFHVIFCRNVMIYFDSRTQEELVNRFADHLLPGGYLMIGHSESLNNIDHPLTLVQPATYRKD